MAVGGLVLTIGLSSGLVWQSMQSRVVPYVVEVDQLGEARAVAPATTDYKATDPQTAWHLGKFIANVRSRSLDPVLMRDNWRWDARRVGEEGDRKCKTRWEP